MKFKDVLVKAVVIFLIFTLLCGFIYTIVVTGLSQLLFNNKANGSIVEINGEQYTTMLGQNFTDEKHMWGRAMSLSTVSFDKQGGETLLYGGASNLTPAGEELEEQVAERVDKIKAAHPEMGDTPVPVDLVTNSGSGLDPEISPAAAEYQVKRLSRANGISEEQVREIIKECTTGKTLGFFGEERVNVVKVNLMLEGLWPEK